MVAKLYDPLGWVTPIIVSSKIFMQQLWRARIGWDEQIPDDLFHNWSRLYTRLSHLNNLHLSRWTGITAETSQVELHGFADASTLAYAAAVYLKVTSATGQITISLLAGKSKIASISPLTVPRLELSAALLLTRLTNFVQRSLPIEPVSVTCWMDSTIVLAWIRSHPSRWKVFVANRVHEIQSGLPDAEWRHVPTQENPADCASRGLCGDELLAHSLWWQGSWLAKARGEWPEEPLPKPVDSQVEAKIIVSHVLQTRAPWDLSSRYASWATLISVTAYIIRFIDACCRRRGDDQSIKLLGRALSSAECSLAKTFWIKRIQSELYLNEINRLTNHQNVASKSSIVSLRPFLDQDGVVRVGDRLRHALIPFRVRHPILLFSHPLVHLIISQAHLRVLHGGTQLTMSTLRQDYWIIRARSLVRSVIHKCLICARERAAVPTQLMGDLPSMRVSPSPRSFAQCGVDYAGPVQVRASAGRGVASRKAYIALFVCLATRAIHLELVSDYSSPAFLNAYVRFCLRRGLPRTMYSDNGTTFVGAEKELKKAYHSALRNPQFLNKTACDNVQWLFIPPSAPHFGGMWKAGVRSVKHHLRRVIDKHTLFVRRIFYALMHHRGVLKLAPHRSLV
ncbi:uncharacterized protein LOC118646695 [Monomorium pharaonis]|uniref:uncharacterized protein LOC118646695 n=1 Tax=Monomorium pharaonis TaxID=307658 RepID=UPI00174738FC|nr:uncharacterized protein LOC118646695 [Monomorium pharaonis]